MILCVVCAQQNITRKATVLAPHYATPDRNGLVAWVPVCNTHLENWFAGIPPEQCLTTYPISEEDHERHRPDLQPR
jgi:hypothetical protein